MQEDIITTNYWNPQLQRSLITKRSSYYWYPPTVTAYIYDKIFKRISCFTWFQKLSKNYYLNQWNIYILQHKNILNSTKASIFLFTVLFIYWWYANLIVKKVMASIFILCEVLFIDHSFKRCFAWNRKNIVFMTEPLSWVLLNPTNLSFFGLQNNKN